MPKTSRKHEPQSLRPRTRGFRAHRARAETVRIGGNAVWMLCLGMLGSVWAPSATAQLDPCQQLVIIEPRVQLEVVHAGCEDYNWVGMYVGNPACCQLSNTWEILPDPLPAGITATVSDSAQGVGFAIAPNAKTGKGVGSHN